MVLQSVRGTFGSGGDFVPMVHEAPDAADTVVWLREQPWFTGTFATIGLSYLGYTQWALLADPPPELAAAVITVGPHDFHTSSWGTGSFSLNDFLGWSHMMAHQQKPPLRRLAAQARGASRLERGVLGLPLGSAGRELLGAGSPWYESWIEHPDADDPFWETMRMTAALDRCEVPVLLLSGWQDLFLDQTITQYQHLRDRGIDVAMTIGPWTHSDMVVKAAGTAAAETLTWLGAHLAKQPMPQRPSRVRAVRHPPRLGQPGGLAAGHRRRRDVPAAGGPADRCAATGRRAAVDLPIRPCAPDADRGWAAAGPQQRLPRRHRAELNAPTCSASPAGHWTPTCMCAATP